MRPSWIGIALALLAGAAAPGAAQERTRSPHGALELE